MIRRLAIRPGAIGDLVLSLPALEFLRGGADYFEVWCSGANVPLVCSADHVAPISSTGLDWLGLPGIEPPKSMLAALGSFDDIVSWYGTARREFRDAVRALGLPVRFLDALPPETSDLHAADFFLRQVGGTGKAMPQLRFPRADGNFAVIHPFSGSRRKNWPLERFR